MYLPISGFTTNIIPIPSVIGDKCMNCHKMPKFARKGDICVEYMPVILPILDNDFLIEALNDLLD